MSGSPSSSSSCSFTASRKRPLFSPDSSATVSDEPFKMLLAKSVYKWIAEYDKDLNTTTWLKYEVLDPVHIESLKCSVCETFKDKLVGMRNYNPAFIVGTKNRRTCGRYTRSIVENCCGRTTFRTMGRNWSS